MHPTLLVSFTCLLATPCFGQVTVSVVALTPLTATVSVGAQQVSSTVLSGALGASGSVAADLETPFVGGAHMALSWLATATATNVQFEWRQDSTIEPFTTVPATASTNSCDFLVTLHSAVPLTALLEIERSVQASAGTPLPVNRIDIGADGVFEISENSALPTSLPASFGPQPFSFVVRSEVFGPGSVHVFHRMTLRPQHSTIDAAVGSCAGDAMLVSPTFAGTGIELVTQPAHPTSLSVGVLGLDLQPLLLPWHAGGSCLLVPSADLTVLLFPHSPFDLALPASVRPIDLWVQAVTLQPLGLATTNGHHVHAF